MDEIKSILESLIRMVGFGPERFEQIRSRLTVLIE